jgi:hypothetical protein
LREEETPENDVDTGGELVSEDLMVDSTLIQTAFPDAMGFWIKATLNRTRVNVPLRSGWRDRCTSWMVCALQAVPKAS